MDDAKDLSYRLGADLDAAKTQDEYEELIIANAKYFAVIEIRPGAWRRNEPNLIRSEHPTYDEAIAEARRRYELESAPKRGSLIYAVADFPRSGARDMSTLVEGYPPIPGPYTRQGRIEKLGGKKPKISKQIESPSTKLPPSERYFEGDQYNMVTNVIKPGSNKRSIKFKNRKG